MKRPAARRIRLDLAYDGTDFAGWQRQPGQRTVQGELERVLRRLDGGAPVTVRGAGRTDSGVHARGQVADAALGVTLDDDALAYRLRRMLPADLRAVAVRTVADSFDARRDAVAKRYRYRLDLTAHGDPFLARHALHWPYPLDEAALGTALARLPGRRDWTAFSAASCEIEDRVRTLRSATFEACPDGGWFTFVGEGFLTHMVRILVGTCLDVARGRLAVARIDDALRTRDRALAGPTIDPRGLFLWNVRYHERRG